jgi:hypothetical protein
MSTYDAREAQRMVEITQEPTDDARFDAFIALLASHEAVNEGNEEMAVMVYAGVLPIPEHPTD